MPFANAFCLLSTLSFFLHCRAEEGEDVDRLLHDTKAELEDAQQQQVQGCHIRSKIQWAEEGKVLSTYFFNLEKKQGHASLITAIKTLGGKIVSSVALIVRA